MLKPSGGALFLVVLLPSAVTAQALGVASCDDVEATEVQTTDLGDEGPDPSAPAPVVWRGSSRGRSSAPAPSWAEEACRSALSGILVRDESLLRAAGLESPGLTEIESLVRASPRVAELQEAGSRAESDPPPVLAPLMSAATRSPIGLEGKRVVLLDAAVGDEPGSALHLIVREASPGRLEVGVQTQEGDGVVLRWMRTVEDPTWAPAEGSAS